MANEATINAGLNIRKGNLNYQSQPTLFRADVSAARGPVPGCVLISTDGTDIDLSELSTPGLFWIQNLDDTNYVEYGIWEPATSKLYVLGELLPGEITIGRFSRNLFEEYEGTGTGTSAPTNTLRFKANTAAVRVRIEAFEK